MWPPKRPSAFIGNSRFTSAPWCMRESEVRAQVSGARSAANEFGLMSSAVRQTPLTAMLSPVFNSPGVIAASTVIRRFSPRCSIVTTLPTCSMIPVNIKIYLSKNSRLFRVRIAQIPLYCKVFSEAVQLEALHALRSPMQTFTSYKGNRALAKNLGSIVEEDFIYFARRQSRSVHEGSSFDKQAGNLLFSQALDDRRKVGTSVGSRRDLLEANAFFL